jgi:ATP/ADP translocase
MRDKLRTLLGIEPGEESMVSLLLTQSVFLGIFIGAFDISAHSLLLSTFDEKIMARGYVISGITGLIITSLYSWFKLKLKFRYFAIINLILATALTFILWTALILMQVKWVILIVFVMFGPLNITTLLGFWGTAEQLFTKGQRRRLFPLAEIGLIIGIIVISYTIPILMSFKFQSHEILLVSAISVFVATLVQTVVGKKFSLANTGTFQLTEKPEKRKSPFNVFYEDPLIRITGIYAALSVLTAFFIQYCFMAVTRQQYPVAEDMAAFLGIFTGSMMIFILIIKRFVFANVLRKYGMQTCIVISPVLISGIAAIAAAIGLFMGIGPATTSGFVLFFMFLAIGRLFSKSLNDSVESPALNFI